VNLCVCVFIRSVNDTGMVTDELAVKDRGVQSVKTASQMVSS